MSRMAVWFIHSVFTLFVFWINDRLPGSIGWVLGSMIGSGSAFAIHWEVNRKIASQES